MQPGNTYTHTNTLHICIIHCTSCTCIHTHHIYMCTHHTHAYHKHLTYTYALHTLSCISHIYIYHMHIHHTHHTYISQYMSHAHASHAIIPHIHIMYIHIHHTHHTHITYKCTHHYHKHKQYTQSTHSSISSCLNANACPESLMTMMFIKLSLWFSVYATDTWGHGDMYL